MVAFLVPHGVTPNRAVKVYQAFGKETMDILRRHPYRLCEAAGIGFLTADQIARSLGLDPRSTPCRRRSSGATCVWKSTISFASP